MRSPTKRERSDYHAKGRWAKKQTLCGVALAAVRLAEDAGTLVTCARCRRILFNPNERKGAR